MPLVRKFQTPAGWRDLPDGSPFYDGWHDFVKGQVTPPSAGPWFDPTAVDREAVGVRHLSWIGFPRASLTVDRRDDRMQAFKDAEEPGQDPRGRQFEYFEWHTTRDSTGKVVKVAFSTETPEYWVQLAYADREKVVALYQEHVDPSVKWDDLVDADGAYDPLNRWTTTDGIMHFVNGINNISAALGLAKSGAEAAVTEPVAKDNFEIPSFGTNAADDYIVREVAALGRAGFDITAHDPVGLYIDGWDDSGWTKPDGSPVGNYWRITRGRPGAVLRVEYAVPPYEGFVVGDIRIGGRPVTYGGQLAEHMTSSLPVVVARRPS